MNFYSVILFLFASIFVSQEKHFVEFMNDEVKISEDQKHIAITLPFKILDSFHIQTEKIEDNNFIPTEIHFNNPDGFKIIGYQFSKVQRDHLVLDQLECEVLNGKFEVTVQLEKKSISNKSLDLKGYLFYQACDEMRCFYPRRLNFNVKNNK